MSESLQHAQNYCVICLQTNVTISRLDQDRNLEVLNARDNPGAQAMNASKHETSGRAASSFLIESGQLPQYFMSMLSDVDRARRYHEALASCLAEWRRKHAGDPVVLDLGVGTGLLTYLVLSLDARARVLAVDTNRSALALASSLIAREHPEFLDRVSFLQTQPGKVPAEAVGAVDILVSEILGTCTVSEFAHTYVGLYMRHALKDPSDPYVIPRCTVQYISTYEFFDMPPSMRHALDVATQRAASVGLYCPTGDGGLGVLLDTYESQKVAFRAVRREDYGVCPMTACASSAVHVLAQTVSPSARPLPPQGEDVYVAVSLAEAQKNELRHEKRRAENGALTILEWEALLWGDVWLRNTVEGYQTMRQDGDAISALSRNSAWGFFVAPHTTDLSTRFAASSGTFTVRYRSPRSSNPLSTFELTGPYMDRGANVATNDASSSINLEWVCHIADEDMAARLAKITREAVANAVDPVDKIVVWNDPACGMTAIAICDALADLRVCVECVYSAATDSFAVATRVCGPYGLAVKVAVNRSSRRGEPFVPDATTMFVAPSRLFSAERDGLERYSEARVIPSHKTSNARCRTRITLPTAMMAHGLDVSGGPAISAAASCTWIPVRASPLLAFTEVSEGGLEIEVNEPARSDLPTATLENIRCIAERHDWRSCYARVLAAGTTAFRCTSN